PRPRARRGPVAGGRLPRARLGRRARPRPARDAAPLAMPSAQPLIRPETAADAEAVRAVNALAFGRAAEADLVDALRQDGLAAISLVGCVGNEVVGHILF